jgi:hypothetical protein
VIQPDFSGPYAARVPIARGARGTLETLQIAGRLAGESLLDPAWPLFWRRKLLVETGTDPRDARAVFKNIFDYVKANVGYQPDPLVLELASGDASVFDYVQSPHWTLGIEGFGDCLAHAALVGSIAAALGHGFGFKTLKADRQQPDRFSHVYAMLGYLDPHTGEAIWLPADTTVLDGDFGEEAPNVLALSPAFYEVAAAA